MGNWSSDRHPALLRVGATSGRARYPSSSGPAVDDAARATTTPTASVASVTDDRRHTVVRIRSSPRTKRHSPPWAACSTASSTTSSTGVVSAPHTGQFSPPGRAEVGTALPALGANLEEISEVAGDDDLQQQRPWLRPVDVHGDVFVKTLRVDGAVQGDGDADSRHSPVDGAERRSHQRPSGMAMREASGRHDYEQTPIESQYVARKEAGVIGVQAPSLPDEGLDRTVGGAYQEGRSSLIDISPGPCSWLRPEPRDNPGHPTRLPPAFKRTCRQQRSSRGGRGRHGGEPARRPGPH